MKTIYSTLAFIFIVSINVLLAQTKVFQNFNNINATQNTPYKSVSKLDSDNNVYTAGATYNVGTGDYDCYLQKLNSKGNLQWYRTFGNAGLDFLTSMYILNDTAIYVTGLTTGTSPDIVTIKYSSDGLEYWHKRFDGAYHSYDCGGAVIADDSGYVFITGGSFNSSPLYSDMVILKYSNTGTLVAQNFYDNVTYHLNDVANQISFDSGGKYAVIAGVSQCATNDYRYSTISFYRTNLTFGYSYVSTTTSSANINEVRDLKTDATGIYITGKVKTATQGYNLCLIKLDTALNVLFSKNFDGGYGLDDESNGIVLDNSGNIFLTGYASANSGTWKQFTTLKCDNTGHLLWQKNYSDTLHGDSEANGIAIDNNQNLYVAGFTASSSNMADFRTIKYSNSGAEIWHVNADGSHLNDYATNVIIDNEGRIVVTGQTQTGVNAYKYKVVQYIENKTPPNPYTLPQVLDATGTPSYLEGVLIVKFDRSVLNMSMVNQRGLNCSMASTFIKDTMIYKMGQSLFRDADPKVNASLMASVTTKKMFPNMTAADNISITRSGEKMHVPDFWTTFVFYLDGRAKVADAIYDLRKLFPYIIYSQPDYIGRTDSPPNDQLYDSSASLHPTATYANGNINIEPAWDITTGKSFVKIGVYDTGIDSTHPDLKVTKRLEFDETAQTGINDHGTAVAGIIGAIRNDSIGVAGIAGGTGIPNDSTCKIYDCDIGVEYDIFLNDAAQGIVFGASDIYYSNTDTINLNNPADNYGADNYYPRYRGLGLTVMNHSWEAIVASPRTCQGCDSSSIASPDLNYCPVCHEAVQYAFRNGVSFVASRGNAYGGSAIMDAKRFPSCEKDEFVLNVGGCAKDGQRKIDINSNGGGDFYFSMIGHDIDLLAPGTTATVRTTRRPYTATTLLDSLYRTFSGTSAAAPHVAGVAALMQSAVNTPCPSDKNLSPEDIEYILQRTATDVNSAVFPGYDDQAGWGLMNAGKALQAVKEPHYQIIHINSDSTNITSLTSTKINTNDTVIIFKNPFSPAGDGWPYSNLYNSLQDGAKYYADIYQVNATVNHSSKLSPTNQIIAEWARNSSSTGWSLSAPTYSFSFGYSNNPIDVSTNVYMDTVSHDHSTATFTTYIYKIKRNIDTNITQQINAFYPCTKEQLKFAYSIYIYDSTATLATMPNYPCYVGLSVPSYNQPPTDAIGITNVYPNPSSQNITIEYNLEENDNATLNIVNILGEKIVSTPISYKAKGMYKTIVDVSNYAKGIYFVTLNTNTRVSQKKFIILR